MNKKTYRFGILVSLILAAWLGALSLFAISSDNLGWGAAALLSYAILFGGPLAILLTVTWIAYMLRDRAQIPAWAHAWMLLPTLLAVSIVPVSEQVREGRQQAFQEAHPAIVETHVNFTGSDLWLDLRGSVPSTGAQRHLAPNAADEILFARFSRYPTQGATESGVFPYDGTRLKSDVAQYRYALPDGSPGPVRPLRQLPYPQFDALRKAYKYGEAGLVVYQYFHYPDHVEVAPALARFSGMTEQDMEAAQIPGLTIFTVENHGGQALARLEINGQTHDLGERAIPPQTARNCSPAHTAGPALVDLSQALRLRWQTSDAPARWHEASVTVPAFKQADTKRAGMARVRLYVLPDGTVAAERFEEVRLPKNALALRTTGIPDPAKAVTECEGAFSSYNPQTVQRIVD